MLRSENIAYQVGKKPILKGCSLTVNPGEFTAIVGPNGAGKSTFLKVLAKEIKAQKGNVNFNGCDIQELNSEELSKIRAVMPQHTNISFPFSIEQIIEIGRFPHKTSKKENDDIIESVIKHNKLEAYRGRLYQTLSGGEQQRVQLARIMAQVWDKSAFPKYLLLDEPTSDLDILHQHTLLNTAKEMCEQNMAVLAILHDLNLAAQYASHIVLMKNGEIYKQGLSEEVLTKQNIEHVFEHPVELLKEPNTGRTVIISIPKSVRNETYKQQNYA